MFSPLNIDFSSGWDETEELSFSDSITKLLRNKGRNTSQLFFDYNHYCIDIIQTLVDVPLKNTNYDKLTTIETYDLFVNEFEKIESEIGSSFYNLYIFREIVDIASELKNEYKNRETRENAVKLFRHSVYDIVNSVSKYCKLKDINYEKLLCGLLAFSSQVESILYTMLKNKIKEKEKEYSKLSVKSIEDIYTIIDKEFQTPNRKNAVIYTWNTVQESANS